MQAADLDAKIDEEKAAVQELSEDIEKADQVIADLVTHLKMATEPVRSGTRKTP